MKSKSLLVHSIGRINYIGMGKSELDSVGIYGGSPKTCKYFELLSGLDQIVTAGRVDTIIIVFVSRARARARQPVS